MIRNFRCSNCQKVHGCIKRFSNSSAKSENPKISRYQFEQARKGPTTPGGYVFLLFPAATLGLGVWQTNRRSWKINLIEELKSKSTAMAVDLPYEIDDIEKLEFQKVRVRGRFDHKSEQYIGPRSVMHQGIESESNGLIGNPDVVGWHVITPFHLEGGERHGDTILVNRGWIQNKFLSAEKRSEAQFEGTLDLEGTVRTTEKRQQFSQKLQQHGDKWQYRDIPALASKLGTEPIFLDADVHSSIQGGPIGGQTRVSLRNDHFSYMLTWYTLTAGLLIMWCKKYGMSKISSKVKIIK